MTFMKIGSTTFWIIANLCIFAVATFYNQTNEPNWGGTPDLLLD